MVKSCVAINCTNRYNKTNNISFYKFPMNKKDMLKKWLVKLRREDFVPNHNSYICSVHFEEKCFLKGYVNMKKLNDDAVPTIFDFPEHLQKVRRPRRSLTRQNIIQSSNTNDLQDVAVLQDVNEHNYSLPSSPSKLTAKYVQILKGKEKKHKENSVKVGVLRKQKERQKSKILSLQDLILHLQKAKLLCEKGHAALENFSDVGQEIVKRLNGPKNAEYCQTLQSFALTLQFYSPAAYEYVREKLNLCLPHQNTVRKWVNTVDGKPGFTQEAFVAIKNRIESVNYPVYVGLTFDEMSIRKEIEWDGERFVDYVNFGEGIETDTTEANEVLVIMAIALNCWWKIPIGYFLIRNITAEEKARQVINALQLLHDAGAHCVSVTCDGLSANISMANKLGANLCPSDEMVSWFHHPITGEKVFVLLDACHVFKLLRNCFGDFKILKDPHGNEIKWSYIEALERLQNNEGLRLGNKLSKKHINYHLQKMKVRLAVQVISASCSTALKFLCQDLQLPEFSGSEATAEFLSVCN